MQQIVMKVALRVIQRLVRIRRYYFYCQMADLKQPDAGANNQTGDNLNHERRRKLSAIG